MTVRSFRAPGGSGTLGAVLVETPDMETLQAAQSGHEAHVAEADDGVLTDTVSIFVAGWPQPRPTAVWSALLDRARGEAPNDVLLKE